MDLRIKKWIIFLIAFLLVAGGIVILLVSQEQRLVNMVVRELNGQLKGELTIEKSDISLLRHFPHVSIVLQEARLFPDKTGWSQPVCEFERLYVAFSLPDIIRQKYNVRRLSVHGGRLSLIRDHNGKLNLLEAFKSQESSQQGDTSQLDVNLQKMVLKNFSVSFLDVSAARKFSAHIDELTSGFRMDSNHVTMTLKSKMELDVTGARDTSFFRHKHSELEIKAVYNGNTKLFEISSGSLTLENASFSVEGSADLSEQSSVNFRVKGDKPDVTLITALLPDDVKEILKPFKYDGRLYFDGTVKGKVSKDKLPLIEVSFGCEDAWLLNTGADKKVDQLGFNGYYTNGGQRSLRTSELHLTNLSARPGKGIFKGNFIMRDFTDPHTLVQVSSELELKFLGEFLGIPNLQQINGKIKLDMNFKELTDFELPEQSLNRLKEGVQSRLTIEGLSFNIPDYAYPVRDMNLDAEMKSGKVFLNSSSLHVGASDLRLEGSVSDIHGFLHDRQKPIILTLHASGNRMVLKELLAYDTALSRKTEEEILKFNIQLLAETSVQQLLHPASLPKGKFEMKNLSASFKVYPHVLQNLGASLMVNDSILQLTNFTGKVDTSDFNLSGKVNNYHLWFRDFKVGRTQIAFDFKSDRFAMKDLLTRNGRKYLPHGYRTEEANNVWIQAKINMRYDTAFKFARAEITNVTGVLKKHNFKLKDIHGKVLYGANRVLILDSLKGTIGRSDFDINLRLFAGNDKKMKKKTNSLVFRSKFLDADEIGDYNFTAPPRKRTGTATVPVKTDTSSHAKAFNIFMIPFSDFNIQADIDKLKYSNLWLKDLSLRLRMQEDHYIYLDTLDMKVADGTVGINGVLNGTDPAKIFFKSTIDVEQVDLEKILIKLDHLGEDIVINKNVKGRLSGQIKSYVQVHPNLVPIMSKTEANLKVRVYNGSLVDFAPMQAMAGYFKDKNLRMIRFDTLRNEFSFSNGVLTIPTMTINSSLGFIQMSGKQSLDLNMEYYVRVPMKMVTKVGFNSLFDRKPDEVDIDQVDEIEYSDKNKKIRFMNLKVTGKPEDFKVGLGKDKKNH